MTTCLLTLILLIWFRSDAWTEYCRLFHLDRISFYKDFNKKKELDASLDYHNYLRQYHNNFFVRLITCPICLSVWLGILLSPTLIYAPVIIIFGLLLFVIIDRLLG